MSKRLLLLCLLVLASANASAVTVQQLQQDGHLTLHSWIEPDTALVPGAQVDLYVEVATDRWFAKGTRIGLFDVENAVVMRRVKLAHNSTRRMNGKTWSVQQWQLSLYPQQAGKYQIPALPVDISVSTGVGESAAGRLFSEPFTFQVDLPAAMSAVDSWIAVPALTYQQTFNQSPDTRLEVGDAIVRSITLSAPDTASMLLPKLSPAPVAGSQQYLAQPKLSDQVNRGQFRSSRTDSFTYVISEPGPVELPPITLHWWNTTKNRAETLVIPGQTFKVNGWAWRYYANLYGPSVLVWSLGSLVLWRMFRRVRSLLPARAAGPRRQRGSLHKYLAALVSGDPLAATDQLYRKASPVDSQLRQLDAAKPWQQQLDGWFAPLFSDGAHAPGRALSLWRALILRLRLAKRPNRWPTRALSLSINAESER